MLHAVEESMSFVFSYREDLVVYVCVMHKCIDTDGNCMLLLFLLLLLLSTHSIQHALPLNVWHVCKAVANVLIEANEICFISNAVYVFMCARAIHLNIDWLHYILPLLNFIRINNRKTPLVVSWLNMRVSSVLHWYYWNCVWDLMQAADSFDRLLSLSSSSSLTLLCYLSLCRSLSLDFCCCISSSQCRHTHKALFVTDEFIVMIHCLLLMLCIFQQLQCNRIEYNNNKTKQKLSTFLMFDSLNFFSRLAWNRENIVVVHK